MSSLVGAAFHLNAAFVGGHDGLDGLKRVLPAWQCDG